MATITVRGRHTGRVGVIDEKQFDPTHYERIQGQPTLNNLVGGVPQQSFGGSSDMLRQLLGMRALGIANQPGEFKTALELITGQPAIQSESQRKQLQERETGQVLKGEFDRIFKEWEEIPFAARFLPFASRFSKERADYEVARDRFNDFLVTLVADARITDAERKFYLRSFPRLMESKSVARAKIDGLKQFIDAFAGRSVNTQTPVNDGFEPIGLGF